MEMHLLVELIDTVAVAVVVWVFYFLYHRRGDERLKIVAGAFIILFIAGSFHILFSEQLARSFWVAVLLRLLGGVLLMVGTMLPERWLHPRAVNAFLGVTALVLIGGLVLIFYLPVLGEEVNLPLRRMVDLFQLGIYAVTAVALFRRPLTGHAKMDMLLLIAVVALALSRIPFLWRTVYFDLFFYLGHVVRLLADLLLVIYAYLFSFISEKTLREALRQAENRYRNLLSLIHTAELAASSLDLTTILNRICCELAVDLGFDRCYIVLRKKGENGSSIVALYYRDQNLFVPPATITAQEYPLLCRTINLGMEEEITDLSRANLSPAEKELLGEHGSMLLIPLLIEKKSLGTLYFWRKEVGPFSPELVKLCQTVALVAAMSIRKAFDYEELRLAYLGTVYALVKVIEAKSPYTRGHSERAAWYMELLGRALKMGEDRLDRLKLAAMLHDLGKLAIPENVLSKPAGLSEREWQKMRQHPKIGAEIVAQAPHLLDIVPVIRWHHERMDGNGYPDGLKGEEIPLEARMMAIADAYDAMTSNRPYRLRMTEEEALRELERGAGTQFDPYLVEVFCRSIRERKETARTEKIKKI